MSRRLQRERALQVLYAIETGKSDIHSTVELFYRLLRGEYDEYDFNVEDETVFTIQLVEGIIGKWIYLNDIITNYSTNWSIERISIIDRNILRIALYELVFIHDIPYSVTANEAVELAKKFSSKKSSKFINGILGHIIKDISEGKIT
ncbi:MAG TPA: transcription antitermination factor NusB [Candidatus Eremiobacteraeota bacterium]|nr:MAG: hypothetical protein BWY64_03208 [bacterium ADurb.Bin363]HPZ06984.1 transcription antitermination factor NusB [Candidatus Eremiobacteraeota bacterium]